MALERPLVSLVNLCTRGAAISAIRNGPQMYSVRTEDLPAGAILIGRSL